jgi:lipopolysaccharide transport system permease protein
MHVKVIQASKPWWSLNLQEVIEYREILLVFAWRNIAARYRQMALGMIWVIVEPLALLLIMSMLFGVVLKVPTNGIPYPVFAFAGLVPWLLFSRGLVNCSESLVGNMGIISKIYFPRLILPISALAKDLFDTLVMVAVLLALAALYGFPPGWKALVLPAMLVIPITTAFALGLWTSALLVRFRDLRHVIGITLQVWLYATPIMYSASLVPERFKSLYKLNPMYWATEMFRWALVDQPLALTAEFWVSMGLVSATLVSGLFVFAALERLSVDVQ